MQGQCDLQFESPFGTIAARAEGAALLLEVLSLGAPNVAAAATTAAAVAAAAAALSLSALEVLGGCRAA